MKTHGLGAGLSTVGNTAGAKKNDSIASELAGTKSVPWAIVFGLTLLTLLPALLLSMTPMVRPTGGVSLSAAGAGNTDRTVETRF